jgi:hypothetical protein
VYLFKISKSEFRNNSILCKKICSNLSHPHYLCSIPDASVGIFNPDASVGIFNPDASVGIFNPDAEGQNFQL